MFEKLDQIKPALKDLVKELRKKYAYASVLAVDDDNRGWRISRTGKRINSQGFGGGSGYVVRVFAKSVVRNTLSTSFRKKRYLKSSKQSKSALRKRQSAFRKE